MTTHHPGLDDAMPAETGRRSIEDELAAQPSPSATALGGRPVRGPSRATRSAVLTGVAVFGGLVALNVLGSGATDALDQSNAALSSLAGSVQQACRAGAVRPDPEGVNACARAQVAEAGGALDGPRIAETLRAIIAANPPSIARSPAAIAERARPLLPELDDEALSAVASAGVAAAQGAASDTDAEAVIDESAPAPTTPVEGPRATSISFERDANGSCQAITRFDDDSRTVAPADDASCDDVVPPPMDPPIGPAPDGPGDPAPTTDAAPDPGSTDPTPSETSPQGGSTAPSDLPVSPGPSSADLDPGPGAPPLVRIR